MHSKYTKIGIPFYEITEPDVKDDPVIDDE